MAADDLFSLSQVCADLGVSPGDVETMEEEGLIEVTLVGGRKALTQDQIERLRMILRLQNDLSVNLPGIDVILEMRRKMIQMRREVDEILEFIRQQISRDLLEVLGEEDFPMSLGPGDEFLALVRGGGKGGKAGRGSGAKKG